MNRRAAGSQGFQEKLGELMGHVTDNPLTRSWQQTIGRHVIDPIEVALMDPGAVRPEDLASNVRLQLRAGNEKSLRDTLASVANSVKPGVGNALLGTVDQDIREGADPLDAYAEGVESLLRVLPSAEKKRELLLQVTDPTGHGGYTELGNAMRWYGLGSPGAAYGAVLGGGALATKGVMDLVAMAQEQQREQEQL